MDSDLVLNVEENYNLKTGITEKFSDLDVDEYNETWFNEDSDLDIIQIYTTFGVPVTQYDNEEIKYKAATITHKSTTTIYKTETNLNKKAKIKLEPNSLQELEIEE
ncbi:11346_t:CDS:2 [Cetraspora pellucida]|uniref:11346_t:CDS:1 n=1 Tax=Cetraspora pellucida TaxID=1433469 RepID=A0ACA9L6I5_9GLOM|nr:11346_t:CDS:2 [Cetraspora pellucida]